MSAEIRDRVIDALRTCYDPEIPINIYDLGLIYEVNVDAASDVAIRMTLTSPMCPAAQSLPPEVEMKAKNVEGVRSAKVEVVWDPPCDISRVSEAGKKKLGLM